MGAWKCRACGSDIRPLTAYQTAELVLALAHYFVFDDQIEGEGDEPHVLYRRWHGRKRRIPRKQ